MKESTQHNPGYRFVAAAVKNIFEKEMYPAVFNECVIEIKKRNDAIATFLDAERDPEKIKGFKAKLVPDSRIDQKAKKLTIEALEYYYNNNHDHHFSKENKRIIDGLMRKAIGSEDNIIQKFGTARSEEEAHGAAWENAYEDLKAFTTALKYGLKISPDTGKRVR